MKKKILMVLALAVLLTSCTKKTAMQNNMEKASKQIAAGQSVTCTYKDDQGEIKTYFKKGMSRTEINDFVSIADGEYVYSWSESTKKGSKMSMAAMEEEDQETEVEMPTKEELEDVEAMMKEMQEMYQAECKAGNINNSMFVPPADVEFTDMDAQMKQMREMSENYENMDPNEMSGEDAQKMMEQAGEMMKSMQGM